MQDFRQLLKRERLAWKWQSLSGCAKGLSLTVSCILIQIAIFQFGVAPGSDVSEQLDAPKSASIDSDSERISRVLILCKWSEVEWLLKVLHIN